MVDIPFMIRITHASFYGGNGSGANNATLFNNGECFLIVVAVAEVALD